MSAQTNKDLTTTGNILSLAGCGIIIGFYHHSRRVRQRSARPSAGSGHVEVHHESLFWMAITNVLLNVGGLLYNSLDFETNRSICVLQALHITYFNLANWLWTLCISFNMKDLHPQHLVRVFGAVCWVLPGIVVLPLLITRDKTLVNLDSWCWIAPERVAMRYGTFYGWLLLTYFAELGILIKILHSVRVRGREMRSHSHLIGAPIPAATTTNKGATLNVPNASTALAPPHPPSPTSVVNSNPIHGLPLSRTSTQRSTTSGGANGGSSSSPRHHRNHQRSTTTHRRDPYTALVRRYLSYVFVILFSWIFGIALRLSQLVNPRYVNYPLSLLHTFFSISQMFWLSIVLVLSSHLAKLTTNFRRNRFGTGNGGGGGTTRSRRPSAEPFNVSRRPSTEPINGSRRPSMEPDTIPQQQQQQQQHMSVVLDDDDIKEVVPGKPSPPPKKIVKKMVGTRTSEFLKDDADR